MHILITGSNGFVGSRLMWELEKAGNTVSGIDISTLCNDIPHPNTIQGDIRISADLETLYSAHLAKHGKGIELVIHCAAAKHDFGISRSEYYSHNKTGTRILLNFMRQRQIHKLINISTVGVFGHPKDAADEDTEYNPDHPYGASKLEGEKLAISWQKEASEHQLIVLRPAVIFGPKNFTNVFKLIDMMHRRPYLMLGEGSHIKAVVSLRTVLDMIHFCIPRLKPGFEHYNCVDLPYISLMDFMRLIAKNPGFKVPHIRIPMALAISIGYVFDIPSKLLNIDLPVNSDRMRKFATATYFLADKIRKEGFVQKQSLEESIKQTTDWYLTYRSDK